MFISLFSKGSSDATPFSLPHKSLALKNVYIDPR